MRGYLSHDAVQYRSDLVARRVTLQKRFGSDHREIVPSPLRFILHRTEGFYAAGSGRHIATRLDDRHGDGPGERIALANRFEAFLAQYGDPDRRRVIEPDGRRRAPEGQHGRKQRYK